MRGYDEWKTQGPPLDEEWEEEDMVNEEERAQTPDEPREEHWEAIARSLAAALHYDLQVSLRERCGRCQKNPCTDCAAVILIADLQQKVADAECALSGRYELVLQTTGRWLVLEPPGTDGGQHPASLVMRDTLWGSIRAAIEDTT